MRGTRWLLIAAILVILGAVAASYRLQRRTLREQAPEKPASMPEHLSSLAQDWEWTQHDGNRAVVRITAKNVKGVKDTGRTELDGVQLQIFDKDQKAYDLVKSAHAEFSQGDRRLYSEGEVEITLGVPMEGEAKRTLISIKTSGVTFDSTVGKASTDRPTEFVFANGTGKGLGASYDPSTKELHINSAVELHWNAPGAKPMQLESGELTYREGESAVWLRPWARLTRENAVVEAGPTIVHLEKDAIRSVDAQNGHGTDRLPNRHLQYGADQLWLTFDEGGSVQHVAGEPNARLVSASDGAEMTITSRRVDLDFGPDEVLTKALAVGQTVLESKPLPVAGRLTPETRTLRSEAVDVTMRPGGREIATVETHAPGTLVFLPNRAGQHQRQLEGERMTIAYGAQNQIQSFRAVNAVTRTEPTPEEKRRNRAVAVTRSKNLTAAFDPQTGQMTRMEQWENFTYEEADRKARSVKAVLEQTQNRITLETAARVQDASGATSADNIQLDQRNGDFIASGHVNSSRLPERNEKKKGSEMLSGDEPVQALAQSMTSANRNQRIRYEGNVVLWQGANRIHADHVDIDRERQRLTADGHVMTQFLEDPGKQGIFTVVKAEHLVYTEADRLAHYTGGVVLNRPALQVKGADVRAFLAESGSDNRLDKAYADGKVEIVQTIANRRRIGTGEHAEYYTDDERIVLRGGQPQLEDSVKGYTRGTELTYFVNDDRLLVNGASGRPATSRIRR